MKTSELEGAVLDWAVAKCEDFRYIHIFFGSITQVMVSQKKHEEYYFTPSTNWAQGGPIIEREGIDIRQIKNRPHELNEYREDRAKRPGARVVSRALSAGPGRAIKTPVGVGKNEGKWLARTSVEHAPFPFDKKFMSDTPLIAAMRCYVASKLGDEVEVPEELLK